MSCTAGRLLWVELEGDVGGLGNQERSTGAVTEGTVSPCHRPPALTTDLGVKEQSSEPF